MQLTDVATSGPVARLSIPGAVSSLAFSPDGRLPGTASADGVGRVFIASQWLEGSRIVLGEGVVSVAFLPTDVTGLSGHAIHCGDRPAHGTRAGAAASPSPSPFASLALSRDGTRLAVGVDRSARVIDWRPDNEVEPVTTAMTTRTDGLARVEPEVAGPIVVAEAKTGRRVATLDVGDAMVTSSCLAANDSLAIATVMTLARHRDTGSRRSNPARDESCGRTRPSRERKCDAA